MKNGDLVYLANGQQAYLKEQIGDRFIVTRIFEYYVHGNEEDYLDMIEDPQDVIVDKVFDNPPTAKIDEEIKKLLEQRTGIEKENQRLIDENRKLKYETVQLTKTQIDQSKFIINRTDIINAKELALFPSDRIMPIKMKSADKNFYGLNLNMETKISSGETSSWGYTVYYENDYSSSQHLDPKYGILINPTEEEIEEVIKKRLTEGKWEGRHFVGIDDKYLSESQIAAKTEYAQKENQRQIEYYENYIKDYQNKINMYKENLKKLTK